MADNTRQGDNAVIAADDVGGVLVQRVKPAFGPDGEATDVSAASPLPVSDSIGELILLALLEIKDYAFNTDLITYRCLIRGDGDLVDTTGALKVFQGNAA